MSWKRLGNGNMEGQDARKFCSKRSFLKWQVTLCKSSPCTGKKGTVLRGNSHASCNLGMRKKRQKVVQIGLLDLLICILIYFCTVNTNLCVGFSLFFGVDKLMPLRYYKIVIQTATSSWIHSREVEILK